MPQIKCNKSKVQNNRMSSTRTDPKPQQWHQQTAMDAMRCDEEEAKEHPLVLLGLAGYKKNQKVTTITGNRELHT